ncbi:MAG: hypothetical protein PWQ28_414 [Candidatus Woesearchaeota archaeon]|nr:hypothetical protein [Candidatus Woesearchaeota archaeon]
MLDKKAYFFTLDAILGLSILVMGIAILFVIEVDNPPPKSFDYVTSVRNFYSGKVESIDFNSGSPFADELKSCFYDGLCNLENRIDEQILILCEQGNSYCNDIASNSLNELIKASPLLESNLSLSIYCDGSIIYNTTDFEIHDEGKEASSIASSKWVIVASTNTELYGPCIFEVISWS